MIAEAEIQNMSTAEKLETIRRIWDSLEEDIEPPAWQREIIEERLRRLDAGEVRKHTLEECREMFARMKAQEQPCAR